ncbi:MAG: sugar phosphate isomerase/epimerase [Clostridiales bacterium]|nr:sugar phosphate isomerase/epimerase [Clostridiales bacterium]
MLETSVNTDYNNDLHDWGEMEHQIRCLAEAGFTHTQWIHDWSEEYMYSKSEMLQAKAVLEHYGLKAHSIHATEGGRRKDYTSKNEYLRAAGVDLLKNRIDMCTYIGADVMVLHMQLPFSMFEKSKRDMEDYYRQVYKSFDEIKSYAKVAGVRIALENLLFTPMKYQIDKYERIFDRYDEDFIGLCYDSGHASIMSQDNYYLLLEKYHDRLYATHLQDTDSVPPEKLGDERAVGAADVHRVPFTGVLDWNKIAYWVAQSPIELPADFEIGLKYGQSFASHEEEMELLKDCHERAVRFHQMVLNAKNTNKEE